MVYGATIKATNSEFSTTVSDYKTCFDNLSSTWKGHSASQIIEKSKKIDVITKKIANALDSFAKACDDYNELEEKKKKKKKNEAKLKEATANKNKLDKNSPHYAERAGALSSYITNLGTVIDDLDEEIKKLRKSIKQSLNQANSSLGGKAEEEKNLKTQANLAAITQQMIQDAMLPGKGIVGKEVLGEEAWVLENFDKVYPILNKTYGRQESGSSDCGVYMLAAGWTIKKGASLINHDGKATSSEMRRAYNPNNPNSANISWVGSGDYATSQTSNIKGQDRLKMVYNELVNEKGGNPVGLATRGSTYNHYVCAIGVKKSADPNNLKPSDILVYDSAPKTGNYIHYYDEENTTYYGFDGGTYNQQTIFFHK